MSALGKTDMKVELVLIWKYKPEHLYLNYHISPSDFSWVFI